MSEEDVFPHLVEYSTESRTLEALDSIPAAINDVLGLTPERLLGDLAKIHALHARWTTRMSVAKGASMAATAAKEVGFARLRDQHRRILNRMYHKVTVDRVDDAARGDPLYASLCLAEADAVAEFLRLRGLVDAITTKRESLRMLGGVLAKQTYMANDSYTLGAVEDLDEGVRNSLSNATAVTEELREIHCRETSKQTQEKEEGTVDKRPGRTFRKRRR